MQGPKWPVILLACGPGEVNLIVGTCYVPWVGLPVQRRLCPIFVSGVWLPDIHEYSAGCQRTPRFWGVTVFYMPVNILFFESGKNIKIYDFEEYKLEKSVC